MTVAYRRAGASKMEYSKPWIFEEIAKGRDEAF
jgi:hypothetical protein